MKNTTLKAVLAALTIAGISAPLVAAAQPAPGTKIDFTNARNIGGTTWVSISAKQSDGTVVQKGIIAPPEIIERHPRPNKTFYSDASFFFNPTDTVIVNGGNYKRTKTDTIGIDLPSCEIKVSDIKPNTRIIIHDNDCQQK